MDRRYDMAEQVLFDILLYLPIMSLLRFKSVCKSWFSIIESSTFIIEHFNYNNDKEDNIITSRRHHVLDISPSSENEMLQLFMLSGRQYENCVDINFEQLLWHPAKEVEFIGSCNGIVCLYHSISSGLALWNPALKQLRPLPQPLFPGSNSSRYFTAFGTDATNDFKVLRISLIYSKKYYSRDEEVVMLGNQAEVYNLRDNSWRITHKNDDLFFTMNLSSVSESKSTGGECFWISHDHDYFPMLLSFDFNDEVFRTMLLPDAYSNDDFDYYLDTCDDRLVYIRAETCYVYEIWILHKNGVNESWNKLYNTGSLSHLGSISRIGLSKSAEFFISLKFGDGDPKLYLYNLHTGKGQLLQYVVYGFLIHCNASLFSVRSANGA